MVVNILEELETAVFPIPFFLTVGAMVGEAAVG
jgi:hypothetical protein